MSESLREVPTIIPNGDSLFLAFFFSKLLKKVLSKALGSLLHGHKVHVGVTSGHSSSKSSGAKFYSRGKVLLECVKIFVLD